MRLFIDEDSCDGRLIQELRRLGVEVLAADELGRKGLPDDLQLEFATAAGSVLMTANIADFHALHSEWASLGRDHAGILIWKKGARRSAESLAAGVLEVLTSMAGMTTNAILRVPSVK